MNIEVDLLNAVKERFEKNIQFLKVSSRSILISSPLTERDEKKLWDLLENEIVEQKNKLLEHSQIVKRIALDICRKIDDITEKDCSLIASAALLHDIEKVFLDDYDDDHNIQGAKYIKNHGNDFLKFISDDEKELICLMVRWHKDDKNDKNCARYSDLYYSKKQIKMIEIVRIADKISKVYKKNKYKVIKDIYKEIKININELQDENIKKVAQDVLSENFVYRLETLYQLKKIDDINLEKAVEKGLISKEQKDKITEQ